MAFSTTVTITINSIAKVLNRVKDGEYSSEYYLRAPTEEFRLNIRHSNSTKKGANPLQRGVDRHNMEFIHTIFATATTPEVERKAYTVITHPANDDVTAVSLMAQGAFTYTTNVARIDDQLAWLS